MFCFIMTFIQLGWYFTPLVLSSFWLLMNLRKTEKKKLTFSPLWLEEFPFQIIFCIFGSQIELIYLFSDGVSCSFIISVVIDLINFWIIVLKLFRSIICLMNQGVLLQHFKCSTYNWAWICFLIMLPTLEETEFWVWINILSGWFCGKRTDLVIWSIWLWFNMNTVLDMILACNNVHH